MLKPLRLESRVGRGGAAAKTLWARWGVRRDSGVVGFVGLGLEVLEGLCYVVVWGAWEGFVVWGLGWWVGCWCQW